MTARSLLCPSSSQNETNEWLTLSFFFFSPPRPPAVHRWKIVLDGIKTPLFLPF